MNQELQKSHSLTRVRKHNPKRKLSCCYCWDRLSNKNTRSIYDGVLICKSCFELTSMSSIVQASSAINLEEYSHNHYLTRTAIGKFETIKNKSEISSSFKQAKLLHSYGPSQSQLYSLFFDTSYFDIPGKAPRWATHAGTDYHGTCII